MQYASTGCEESQNRAHFIIAEEENENGLKARKQGLLLLPDRPA